MFEDLINSLESLGVTEYTESPEEGTLTIDLAPLDKTTTLDVITAVSSFTSDFTIEGESIIVRGVQAEPMPEEGTEEEFNTDQYLDEALGF